MTQYFYNMLLIQLLTIRHVVIHIGIKDDINGSLKYCNFKISKNPWKTWNVKPADGRFWKKGPRYYEISCCSKYVPPFNQLMIKNTYVQKARPFFIFMEWLLLPQG